MKNIVNVVIKVDHRFEAKNENEVNHRFETRNENNRERSSILSDYAISKLSYTFFISRSRVMFSLSNVQFVYQNSSSNSIKLKESSKRQIQNFIK